MKSIRLIMFALMMAVVGTGCASSVPTASAEKLSPWQDPVWLAEQEKKKKNGEKILAELNKCQFSAVRALAYSNIPAIAVVAKAYDQCKIIEKKWVDSQISSGITREQAEQVIQNANNGDSLQILRNYVIDLRAMRDKAPPPAPQPPALLSLTPHEL